MSGYQLTILPPVVVVQMVVLSKYLGGQIHEFHLRVSKKPPPAGCVAGLACRPVARSSNADRNAFKHRSARSRPPR